MYKFYPRCETRRVMTGTHIQGHQCLHVTTQRQGSRHVESGAHAYRY